MRLLVLSLFFSIGVSFANNYAQTAQISINAQNKSVAEILEDVEQQSEFSFIYDSKKVDTQRRLSVQADNQNIFDVLSKIFSGSDIAYTVINKKIVLNRNDEYLSRALQGNTITGTVVDTDGNPLPGVTVIIKGTIQGTATDANGAYSLAVPNDNTTLVFTYVGYTGQEILAGARRTINVTMTESTSVIDEVVVIGYGAVRKSDLTGAVSSVTSKHFESQPIIRVQDALQGRVAGMEVANTSGAPDGGIKIRIRGVTSVNRSSDPLVIVDGLDAGLGGLNSNDIQSIEVLKDASSTAVYGSRGANGVILVTTKRGQAGRSQVSFETELGIAKIFNKYDMLSASEFAVAQRELRPETISDAEVALYQNGTRPGVNWWDEMTRTGFNQIYSLNISGGNAGLRYLVSGKITEQTSTGIEKSYAQQMLRANLDATVYKWLDITLNLSANRSNTKNGNPNLWSTLWYAPTVDPILDPNTGIYTRDLVNCTILESPLSLKTSKSEYAGTTFRGNVDFRFKILEGLTLSVLGGISNGNDQYYSFSSTLRSPNTSSSASQQYSYSLSWRNINNLTYLKQFGDHHLTLTGVAEFTKGVSSSLTGNASSLRNEFVEHWNLQNGTTNSSSNSYSASSMSSFFGRLIYNYKNRYLLTGTMRADGSSRFQGANKWGYFPSGAVAWNIAEESFMESQKLFQQLKLRASLGVSGSQAINSYQTIPLLSSSSAYYSSDTAITGYWINTLANPDLKWETTAQFDVGLDFSILNNRANVSLDWYRKNTTDLLFQKTIPSYHGGGSFWVNGGELRNTGIELSLDVYPVRNSKFTWESILTGAYQRNKVIDLAGLDEVLGDTPYWGTFLTSSRVVVGKPVGSYWLYEYLGLNSEGVSQYNHYLRDADNNIIGVETTNIPSTADKVNQGNVNPSWTIGWNNNFSYGNWEANFLFTSMLGMDRLNLMRSIMAQASVPTLSEGYYKSFAYLRDHGGNTADAEFADRLNPDNRNQQGDTNKWLENANFLRLRNLSIAYRIPKSVLKFADLRITANVQNLFILTKYKGLDPEAQNSWNEANTIDAHGGQDLGAFPNPRTFTFGLRFDF